MHFAMKLLRSGILVFSVTALVFASCSQDEPVMSTPDGSGREISFSACSPTHSRGASVAEVSDEFHLVAADDSASVLHCAVETTPMGGLMSRAMSITTPDAITKIGVIAHASWYGPLLMDNDLYERDASGVFKSREVRFWIDDADATVDFYAFTPYNLSGVTFPSTKESTRLSYAVPQESADQQDFLLAVEKNVKGNYKQAVGLDFRHLLAGVKVRFAEMPVGWSVKSITLEGVHRSGNIDFAADNLTWVYDDAADGLVSATADVTSETLFMVLPQSLSSDSAPIKMTIEMFDGANVKTYRHDIVSANWTMGNITTYSISVSNYEFSIDDESPVLDAHYVIYKTNINARNLPAGKEWTVTCVADTDKPVTIQLQSDMNIYAKDGFWTDRIYEGESDVASARGESKLTLSGSGSFPVAIFLPENVGNETRDISLSIAVDGRNNPVEDISLKQLKPAWTSSNYGWEQIDDGTMGEYGFKWDRIAYYGYVYTINSFNRDSYKAYCQSVIDENNAQSYASIGTYPYKYISSRYYIKINYNLLSNLRDRAVSETDGLDNTVNLYKLAGSATTGSFETVVSSILKTEAGHTTEHAFRLGNGARDEAPAPTGDNINGSPAVGECVKKNRFNLQKTTSPEGDVSLTPIIATSDIVWYLPAVDQFSNIPAEIVSPVTASECWSSTAVGNGASAYLGNRTLEDRLVEHKVRAVRKRPL